ncbi:unnamed protein product [Lepidochelys olivacea]
MGRLVAGLSVSPHHPWVTARWALAVGRLVAGLSVTTPHHPWVTARWALAVGRLVAGLSVPSSLGHGQVGAGRGQAGCWAVCALLLGSRPGGGWLLGCLSVSPPCLASSCPALFHFLIPAAG